VSEFRDDELLRALRIEKAAKAQAKRDRKHAKRRVDATTVDPTGPAVHRRAGRAWTGARRHVDEGGGPRATGVKLWAGKGSSEAGAAAGRARRVANVTRNGVKSPAEIRILYLKKRHAIVKLRRKYPEVDFDRPDREKARAQKYKKLRGVR
jgi:hypothetical protein